MSICAQAQRKGESMKEMTSLERVQAVLNGQTPDRVPVVPQCFMFSAKTAGYHIGQINRSPAKLAESHRICQEKYGYDGCVIDVDDATLAEACGAKVIFRERDVASVDEHHPVLESLEQIDELKLPEPMHDGRLCEWLETSSRLMDMVGDHVFVMGRADQGPFDLLALLRGAQEFMIDLLTEDEDVIRHALDWAAEAHIRFARAQLAAGVHATSMGDSYAGPNLVSPDIYRRLALPAEKKVVDALKDLPGAYSIHICGDTSMIVGDMGKTGAKILEVDWKVDMGRARTLVPEDTVLMVNINPSDPMCLGTPGDVHAKAKEIIDTTRGRGLILSSGCALSENIKPENLQAMVDAAGCYGAYDRLCELQQQ